MATESYQESAEGPENADRPYAVAVIVVELEMVRDWLDTWFDVEEEQVVVVTNRRRNQVKVLSNNSRPASKAAGMERANRGIPAADWARPHDTARSPWLTVVCTFEDWANADASLEDLGNVVGTSEDLENVACTFGDWANVACTFEGWASVAYMSEDWVNVAGTD